MKFMKITTIYIDWNLFSILKNPRLEPHLILQKFLSINKNSIRLVYSPAHLEDLVQTTEKFIDRRNEDLKYLSEQTNNNCIVNYWGTTDTIIENREAQEFFETNQSDNSLGIIPVVDSMRKMMTDHWGIIRDNILKEYFKREPSQVCNFTKDELNEYVKMIGISSSLEDFLKFGLHLRTSPTDILSYTDFFSTAYINLDLIQFFPDTMAEKGNFENLKNDALHSAYGLLCNAFITNDNKCFHKSKFLFDYYGSASILIRTCKVKNMETLKSQLNSILEN